MSSFTGLMSEQQDLEKLVPGHSSSADLTTVTISLVFSLVYLINITASTVIHHGFTANLDVWKWKP